VNLFPERERRWRRWLLPAALILSLVVHAGGAGVAQWWWPPLARALAKALPRPSPTPEIVALSDAITIEKRTVPRPVHRSPQRQARRPQPRPKPRVVARLPELEKVAVPTLPPVSTPSPTVPPTSRPTAEPTVHPRHGAVHRVLAMAPPRRRAVVEPQAATQSVRAAPQSAKAAFEQKVASYQAQWSQTIAQAQRSLTDVPPQRRPPSRMPNQRPYEAIMAGTPEQFLSAFQGDCVSLQGPMPDGGLRAYYIRCFIRYNDGYFENVSFPWVYQFPSRRDPFDIRQNPDYRMTFPPQGPPPGFVLPPHFALSRAVCSFYKSQCQDLIDREKANGNQPVSDQ
jgi:hypothetical protein